MNTDTLPTATTLKAHIQRLDPNLSAAAMLASAQQAGFETTISSVYATRTALGIAKARGKYERKGPGAPSNAASSNPSDIVIPSDETILANLIVKVGLDRARAVFERVEHLSERMTLD